MDGGAMVLGAAVIRLASVRNRLWDHSGNAPAAYDRLTLKQILAVCCFFCAVVLRSYSGMIQHFPWKDTVVGSAWLLTGAVVLGKMAGGVLADRIGVSQAALRSMCAATVGFMCLTSPLPGILAVLCWNMSMPLTLWAVARVFPGAKGFSFGLLTFGLFLGFCPAYLEGGGINAGGWGARAASSPEGMALMAILSIFLLNWGLKQVTE